jgi:hypothetical protein
MHVSIGLLELARFFGDLEVDLTRFGGVRSPSCAKPDEKQSSFSRLQ